VEKFLNISISYEQKLVVSVKIILLKKIQGLYLLYNG